MFILLFKCNGATKRQKRKSKTFDSSENGGSEQCSQVPDQESQDSSVLSGIISAASNVLYCTHILTKPNMANKTDPLGPITSTPKTQMATNSSGDVCSQLKEQNDKLDIRL